MSTPLRVLIVEDSEDDARLLHRKLELGGYQVASERFETEAAMRAALAEKRWDLILCDHVIPGFGGSQALAIAKELDPDLPFILVSGKIDEEIAVEVLKAGASDFVTKAHLERLLPAVRRELASAAARRGMRRAQVEWRAAFDAVRDAVFIHDAEFRVVRANLAYAALAGMPVQEIVGKRYWEAFPRREGPLPGCAASLDSGAWNEETFAPRDGETFTSRHFPISDATGKYVYSLHVLQDVTERNRVQEAIEKSERRFRALIEQASDLVVALDVAGSMTYCSPSVTRMLGHAVNEVVGKNFLEFMHPDDIALASERFAETLRRPETLVVAELRVRRADGTWAEIESIARNVLADPAVRAIVVNVRDVTERKRAEEVLEASERKFRDLVENVSDWVWEVDARGVYTYCSPRAADILGYAPEELVGKSPFDLMSPAEAARVEPIFNALVAERRPLVALENVNLHKGGREVVLETSGVPVLDAQGALRGYRGIDRDITERKRTEEQLRRFNWALRALGESNSALVRASSERELFGACCKAIAGSGGYPLAWIGLVGDDPAHGVEVVAAAGEAVGFVEGLELTWDETRLGRGPTGTAIRTATTQVRNDLASDSEFAPWLARARASGLASSVSLPIRADSRVIGALVVYARTAGAFTSDELKLLEELAGDIGYGIAARRTRAAYEAEILERARQDQRLRATFESAIEALAATVEQRDPYTAGHQRRVAALAVAIGRELGLDEERLEGLRIASTIHDIGKISVPAEILARPGRLSSAEFEIVKSHAQMGYDIVKGVDFPWPIAQTILQHHERLDGAGYPRGLKDGQILLEARILAVADTVEAMSAHRPYRPGLGLDAALQQIESDSGKGLDAAAVAACVRLFRGKGFRLPS